MRVVIVLVLVMVRIGHAVAIGVVRVVVRMSETGVAADRMTCGGL